MLIADQTDIQSQIKKYSLQTTFQKPFIDRVQEGIISLSNLKYSDETNISFNAFTNRVGKGKLDLISQFISVRIEEHFTRLDEALFDIRRYIKVQNIDGVFTLIEDFSEEPKNQKTRENKIYTRYITIPLLVSCNLNQNHCDIGYYPLPGKQSETAWLRTYLPATMPETVIDQQIKVSQIINQAVGELLDNPIVAKELIGNGFRELYGSKYKIYWIPKLQDISVDRVTPTPEDPILVMEVADSCFLIDSWDEPRESRLNACLEEFGIKR